MHVIQLRTYCTNNVDLNDMFNSCWPRFKYLTVYKVTSIDKSEIIMTAFAVAFFSMAQQPLIGQGLLIFEASRSQSDTQHSVGLLCVSYQPDAETCTTNNTHKTQTSMPPLGFFFYGSISLPTHLTLQTFLQAMPLGSTVA
jgi:hypothetical protein